MEVYFNNILIGVSPKSSKTIIINNLQSDQKTLIQNNNVLKCNNKIFNINDINDNLNYFRNKLNNEEFAFNTDMYESLIPLKYSIIKKNNDIYLYSVELN